jgi:tetratricopeptide (TPR) repeat protein
MKDDENYALMISKIYVKIAKCYENLSDWFNALKFYNIALEYFAKFGDSEKLNEMRLAIANIFYNTYKHDKAEILLNDILKPEENISNELKIRAYLLVANIKNDDIKIAYKNYKSAFLLIDSTVNKKILAELYFKFGAICDDIDETETAIKLYKRCIDIQKDNPYLTTANFNLATIYEDNSSVELAAKYYKESLKLDTSNDNKNGIYEAAMKIAHIYKHKSPDDAVEYYKIAINTAKEINDPYYIMISNIDYGDFYYDRRDFKKALKLYIRAMSKTKNTSTQTYKSEIELRIRELKIRLGDEAFKQLESEIIKNG